MKDSAGLQAEIERLKNENNTLKSQLKKILKAESKLYSLQENLDKQRKIYYSLNEVMQTINTFRKTDQIAAVVAAFVVNILRYEKCIFLAIEYSGNEYCCLTPLAFEGYYGKAEQEQIGNLALSLPRQQLETIERNPIMPHAGKEDLFCNSLFIDDYIAACLKNNKESIYAIVIAGNSAVQREYYSEIGKENELYIAFRSVTSHTCTVFNNIESYRAIEHEQKLLAGANEELKRLDQLKMDFFSNISHEIRTPLTLSLGPVEELLKQDYFKKRDYSYLKTIHINQLRLLKLINELLDISRLESGGTRSVFAKQDIVELLKLYVGIIESAALARNIRIRSRFPGQNIYLYIDENKFEKIMMNLLSNALKFTNDGGTITVYVEAGMEQVIIAVSDTGIGIPEAQYEAIFDRFSQVDSSETRAYSGTGIGLSLVREFIKMHGGTITVKSRVGKGSTFTAAFPVGKKHLDPELLAAKKIEKPPRVHASPPIQFLETPYPQLYNKQEVDYPVPDNRPCVLVVDDNQEMRQYIASLLYDRYNIVEKANGVEALKYAKQNIPDLIISDVMMPVMSGYELCREIKSAEGALNRVPVILITARAELSMKIKGLAQGADDYLSKPFSSRELQSRAANLIKIHDQEKALVSTLADLNTAHKQLEENYKTLRLTRSEFAAISRRVGRSEIASDIMHNFGNKLNSISITMELLFNQVNTDRDRNLGKIAALLETGEVWKAEEKKAALIAYLYELDKYTKQANEKIIKKVNSLAKHINDLKLFLRHLEKNTNIVKLEESCSINAIIKEALVLIDFDEDNYKIDVILNFDNLPPVLLDKHKLLQIIFELLMNARKACQTNQREEKYIKVSTCQSDNFIEIEVADNGIGMEKDKIDKIFSIDEHSKNIGLHMCANFIDILRGQIQCYSGGPGQGTVFIIKLPNSIINPFKQPATLPEK